MPIKLVRYKTWFAAFVALTIGLGLTSSHAIPRAPHNNSNGAASSLASAAGADSISPAATALPAADPPIPPHHSVGLAATAAAADVALLPAVDKVIYYWVARSRGLVRGYWFEPSALTEAPTN